MISELKPINDRFVVYLVRQAVQENNLTDDQKDFLYCVMFNESKVNTSAIAMYESCV